MGFESVILARLDAASLMLASLNVGPAATSAFALMAAAPSRGPCIPLPGSSSPLVPAQLLPP